MGCTAAAVVVMAQPVWAAETEVTNIQLTPTTKGFALEINTQGNNRPPIFTVNRGNNSIVDINNAQLRLADGQPFEQVTPVPGINAVEVRQLDERTIRVVVEGVKAAPITEVIRQDNLPGRLMLTFDRAPSANDVAANPELPSPNQPLSEGRRPTPVPPSLPRAKAPPVGDLAIAPLEVQPDRIELDSDQIIPKLLLREAPVREVLTLLGRAAGVNVAFAENGSGANGNGSTGPTISLDIEGESVEDVFNYVLRLSGLQANREGQTVFVGKDLPGAAQNRVVRTIRLNQIRATSETKTVDSLNTEADTGGNLTPAGSENESVVAETLVSRKTQTEETILSLGAKEILETYGANAGSGRTANSNLLENLEVIADGRTNAITLIGTPRKVELATSILLRLDVRQRQVAVNVKFVDINLLKGKNSNADFTFRANDTLGIGFTPDPDGTPSLGIFGASGGNVSILNPVFALTDRFLGTLFASIQDTSAKILTNPTILIQEGSSAQVNLTEQVFSGFETTAEEVAAPGGGTTAVATFRPIIQNAGVIFNVTVHRIDDNGFITLSMSPEVSALSGITFEAASLPGTPPSTASLLTQRRLETGKIRLRDGQTLVLTGIIQDQDRVSISKVPILGDIPLLGRLFRAESNERERSELIVLVTPQILDDSDQSSSGYPYTPSEEAQDILKR